MYAQKFNVNVVIQGETRPCPLEWLDQFCMRNFTNSADFDDTLPVADGKVEASFRLSPERFSEGLAAWLTQRGKAASVAASPAAIISGVLLKSSHTKGFTSGSMTMSACVRQERSLCRWMMLKERLRTSVNVRGCSMLSASR